MRSNENSTKAILCSGDEIKTRSFKIAHTVKKNKNSNSTNIAWII